MMQKFAVVGTPMPRTMQQSMVRNSATNLTLPASPVTAPMSWLPRPVMVMEPATQPAIAQAAIMEMQLLPPLARELNIMKPVSLTMTPPLEPSAGAGAFIVVRQISNSPTNIARTIATDAENAMV